MIAILQEFGRLITKYFSERLNHKRREREGSNSRWRGYRIPDILFHGGDDDSVRFFFVEDLVIRLVECHAMDHINQAAGLCDLCVVAEFSIAEDADLPRETNCSRTQN